MARNPIALNDGGVFRFVDFMNYVPDFLKEEKDVITLMQLFSDYLNNAYRNVDVSRKFYFNFSATESILGKVRENCQEFVDKLRASANNNLYVYFLSMPRTNANTNSIKRLNYINSPVLYEGEFNETLNIDILLNKLTEYNSDGNELVSDGDVVYIKYTNGNVYPYYVNKDNGTLRLDPHNSSQDPFHDTVNHTINGAPRMVKFLPKDVGEIITTELGEINGVQIYDVKFEFIVDDVKSVSSHYIYENGDDSVEMDYYAYLKGRPCSYDYYVSLGMYNNTEPFKWISDAPRGIFYFKELRDFIAGDTNDMYKEWKLIKIEVLENGTTCYAVLNSVCNLHVGDLFHIESDEVIGVNTAAVPEELYTLNGDFIISSVIGNVISFELKKNDNIVKLSKAVSKFMTKYNRMFVYSIDYTTLKYDVNNYKVKIQWDSVIGEMSLKEGSVVKAYDAVDNLNIGSIHPLTNGEPYVAITDDIPLSVGDVFYFTLSTHVENDIITSWLESNGDILYEPLKVVNKRGNRLYLQDVSSGVGVHFDNRMLPEPIDDAAKRELNDADDALVLNVVKLTAGFGTVYTNTDDDNDAVIYGDSRIPQIGDVCFISEMSIDDNYNANIVAKPTVYHIVDVHEIKTNSYYVSFDNDISLDYDLSRLQITYLDAAKDTPYAILDSLISNKFAKCYVHRGDIYSHDYWMDDKESVALKCAYTDEIGHPLKIFAYREDGSYNIGDVVYYSDGLLYKAVDSISAMTEDTPNPFASGKFIQYMYNCADMQEIVARNEYMYGLYSISELSYGETVDVSGYNKYNEVLNTIFVEKADDNSLYYNWKDREYLLNQNVYNKSGKHRNGFAEFYSTGEDYDIVTDTVESYSVATATPDSGIILRKLNNTFTLAYDRYIMAEKIAAGEYKFTINYESHGLPDNGNIRIKGAGSVDGFAFDTPSNGFDRITVVNKDKFYFIRHVDYDFDKIISESPKCSIEYLRGFFNPIVLTEYYYKDSGEYKAGYLYVSTKYPHGYSKYSKVTVENAPNGLDDMNGWISDMVKNRRIDIIVDENTYAIAINDIFVPSPSYAGQVMLQYGGYGDYSLNNSYSVVYPEENDCVKVGDTYYKVTADDWEELSGDSIYTPFVLYSHQNLMDVSDTNRQSALCEENLIESITFDGVDTVKVITKSPMNLVPTKSSVYISNVYPLSYCGRFIVDEVMTDRMFTYKVVPHSIDKDSGTHIFNGIMKCYEAGWYKYTVYEVMFNRRSKYDIYKYGVKIVDNIESVKPIKNLIVTEYEHGYSEGDRIVLTHDDVYVNAVVDKVLSTVAFTYTDTKTDDFSGGYVFKGVYIPKDDHSDNITPRGEYSKKLHCLSKSDAFDDGVYKFTKGDIVFTHDQLATDTPSVYCVNDNIWDICSERRIMKIKDMDVDRYHNNEWDFATNLDNIDEYVYRAYTYAEIADEIVENADDGIMSYINPFSIRNYNFSFPTIDHLDTTEAVNYQFDSKHDYASVAPRYDFEDTSFRGIPDMKYPLVEKLERLIYLRDANVIDYDLIGYLARYMGYDITDAKANIDSSIVYKTYEQKEAAVRETISNLPQYYSLGGTKPGLEMLLTTFGIVADVITMWTNLNRPYDELIEEGEVRYRTDSDYENGIISQWAPTPHVKVRISSRDNFRTSFANEKDFNVLIKNIKVFKPIQVVFDEFIKYVETPHGVITMHNVTFANKGKMNIDINYDIFDYDDALLCSDEGSDERRYDNDVLGETEIIHGDDDGDEKIDVVNED